MKRILFFFLLLLWGSAQAATLHICGDNGQGGADGSSLANAGGVSVANGADNGDTVLFYDDCGDYTAQLKPNATPANESQRITFQAATGETPRWYRGETLAGPWTLESGDPAAGTAIYSMPQPNVIFGQQWVVFESDPGKESEDSSCFNVPKPRPGGVALGTGNECSYGGNVFPGIDPIENGDAYVEGGKLFVRTSHGDNPSNYTIISTVSGTCMNFANKSYMTVDGLSARYCAETLTAEASNHFILENNDFKYNAGYNMVQFRNATNDIIRNNKFRWCGTMDGHRFDCIGHNKGTSLTLIEGNEIAFWGHTSITAKSNEMVIRNNYFHDGGGKPIGTDGDNKLFIYGNQFRKCRGAVDLEGTAHPNDHPCITISGDNNVVAFNEAWGKSSRFIFHGRPGTKNNNAYYHNTIANSVISAETEINIDGVGTSGLFIKNNLIGPFSTVDGTECTALKYGPSNSETPASTDSDVQGNTFYTDISCTNYFRRNNTYHTVASFESTYSSNVSNNTAGSAPNYVRNSFDNPDFGLVSGSEGIDKGVPMTTTSGACSGDPSQVNLNDATWVYSVNAFINNGIIDNLAPRLVTIGDDTGLKITNRSNNTITLDRQITCAASEDVSFDYDGSAPDSGANEGTNQPGTDPPSVTNDTLASQTEGYTSFSVAWSTLYANDSYTSATTPTVGDITGLTTGLCTVANDAGNTEVDVTEVTGTGPCLFTYTLTDDNGTSVTSAQVTTQINAAGGSSTPLVGSVGTVADCTGDENCTISYPSGVTSGDSVLVLIAGVDDDDTDDIADPSGWTSAGYIGNSADAVSGQVFYRVADSGSSVNVQFGKNSNKDALAVILRLDNIDTTDVLHASDTFKDPENSDATEDCPSVTSTTSDNALRLCIGVTKHSGSSDTYSLGSPLTEHVEAQDSDNRIGIAAGSEIITPAGTVPSRSITRDTSNQFINTWTLVFNAETSGAVPTVLADTFTAANDTAIDGRSPETGAGTYEAAASADIDSNAQSADAGDGFIVPAGVVDATYNFNLGTGNGNQWRAYVRSDSEVPALTSDPTQNSYTVEIQADNDQMIIGEYVGGSFSQLGTFAQTFDASTTYAVAITTNDGSGGSFTTISVAIDAGTPISVNTNNVLKGTFFGFYGEETGTWTFDDLSVTSTATADATAPNDAVHNGSISVQNVTLTINACVDAGVGCEGYEVHKNACDGNDVYTLLEYTHDGSPGQKTYNTTIGEDESCKFKVRWLDNAGNISGFSTATEHTGAANAAPACDATLADSSGVSGGTSLINVVVDANCTDANSDPMTVTSISSQASNGAATVTGGEEVQYIADEGFTGDDTFTAVVGDGNGGTDSVVVTVTVAAFPSGTLKVSGTLENLGGSVLANATNIDFHCWDPITDEDIDSNYVDNFPYQAGDETTDANGLLEIPLFSAATKGYVEGQEIRCAIEFPTSAGSANYISAVRRFTIETQP